jgi:hypothetical protein
MNLLLPLTENKLSRKVNVIKSKVEKRKTISLVVSNFKILLQMQNNKNKYIWASEFLTLFIF